MQKFKKKYSIKTENFWTFCVAPLRKIDPGENFRGKIKQS